MVVLIIEDNERVSRLTESYLKQAGYEVRTAFTGEEGLELFYGCKPDLVVLDIMLPVMSGMIVLQKIRETSSVPVIMVTAKSEEMDKLKGLRSGADDYVVKPFSPKELVARVDALFRRIRFDIQSSPDSDVLTRGDLVLDNDSRAVRLRNRDLGLTSFQFNLLKILMESPGKVFSRQMLLDRMETDESVNERTIDVHIKNIRKILKNNGEDAGLIQTVFGAGYRFGKE